MNLSHCVEEVMGNTLERGYTVQHCGFVQLHADFLLKLLVKVTYINHPLAALEQDRDKCFA